jgi:hypothetical protein
LWETAEFRELTRLAYTFIVFYVSGTILGSGNMAIDKINCSSAFLGANFLVQKMNTKKGEHTDFKMTSTVISDIYNRL